jgi:hypothetical protein
MSNEASTTLSLAKEWSPLRQDLQLEPLFAGSFCRWELDRQASTVVA